MRTKRYIGPGPTPTIPFETNQIVLIESYLFEPDRCYCADTSLKARGILVDRGALQTVITDKSVEEIKKIDAVYCPDCDGQDWTTFNIHSDPKFIEEWLRVGYLTCNWCEKPLVPTRWQTYIEYMEGLGYEDYELSPEDREHELGSTELCMHTRTVLNHPVRAWVKGGHGFVLLDNGQLIDGCFHHFPSGGISLA